MAARARARAPLRYLAQKLVAGVDAHGAAVHAVALGRGGHQQEGPDPGGSPPGDGGDAGRGGGTEESPVRVPGLAAQPAGALGRRLRRLRVRVEPLVRRGGRAHARRRGAAPRDAHPGWAGGRRSSLITGASRAPFLASDANPKFGEEDVVVVGTGSCEADKTRERRKKA